MLERENQIAQNMVKENVTLTFVDFESASIKTFKDLWRDEDFTDVTLATGDFIRDLQNYHLVLNSVMLSYAIILSYPYLIKLSLIFCHKVTVCK